ncbi:MAG: CRTAC1 family protein, partial [Acidobacteriaceae bacterium]|nr:CRTAC1 family protein [Acidobacteriaceae bacterium]
GNFISGMGSDFRDLDNDGRPDIALVALNNQTFPLYRNTGKGDFEEITAKSGMSALTRPMSAYGIGVFDFDNDGWKDLFIARGHIDALPSLGEAIDQFNTVMRNLGSATKWSALTEEAGFDALPPARHRGCAFGDLDGDGRIDVVVTALARPAEVWMNRSPSAAHWLDIALQGTRSNRDGIGAVVKVVTKTGTQWNHMTTSVGYASSSDGPVHFGLGTDSVASSIEIRWPSGIVQTLANVRADRVISVAEPGR